MTASDLDLLEQYAQQGSETAFAALVERHLNLVYSAALRQVRSPQLAEETSQSVFTDLSQNARRLKPDTVLTAWLYQVTRRTAVDMIRREARRQLREQIAVEMNAMNATTADWKHIEPLLDDAMAALDETDRAAVLLRYFENKSLREVGEALGTSDDTAQKRVSRAVDRLREFLVKRGITVAASGLMVVISTHAVKAAPIGLAATITTATTLAGSTVAASTVIATTKSIAMTTAQNALVAAALIAAVGTGIYQAHQASDLRGQIQTLKQQPNPTPEQIQQFTREREESRRQLAALRQENEKLNRNSIELLRLRGEVARLSGDTRELAQLKATEVQKRNDPIESETKSLLARVNQLKQQLDQTPDQKIPELQFVTDKDWLLAVTKNPVETDTDGRRALVTLRNRGKLAFAPLLRGALQSYISANDGLLPADISQLRPYFQSPVEDAILQRYQLLQTGKLGDLPPEDWLVAEKAPVDTEYDTRLRINNTSFSIAGIEAYPKRP